MLQRAYQDESLRTLLPGRIELCIAGNGGQLLKALSPDQTDGLCKLALQGLCAEHPIRAILTVQSANPKQEAALGLLSDERTLQSTLQAAEKWNGTFPSQNGDGAADDTLEAYFIRFCRAFPQAANRLMAEEFETDPQRGDVRLTPTAKMELETILQNERGKTPEDDFSTYVRVFTGVKRLWRI